MGFLTSFNRTMYLSSYVNNLQQKLNDITQEKLTLTDQISKFISEIADIADKDSPAVKKLEARKADLEALDKHYDAEMKKIQTQLQAAQTEQQSADQSLQQGIQKGFSYSLAGG